MAGTHADDIETDGADATVPRVEEEGTSRRSMAMEMTPIGGALLMHLTQAQ